MVMQMKKTARQGGFFITGTDTEIGKSHVTASLGRTLSEHGIAATPRKPIASGCILQADGSLLSEDAALLHHHFETQDSLDQVCPYLFEPAVSPHLAMQSAGQSLTIEKLAENCQPIDGQLVFVEGAGGFYSPIAADGLNSDLAQTLGYPVILVVGDRLGCINHALLTIDAIEANGLILKAIIVNQLSENSHYSLTLSNYTHHPIYHSPYSPIGQPSILSESLIHHLID